MDDVEFWKKFTNLAVKVKEDELNKRQIKKKIDKRRRVWKEAVKKSQGDYSKALIYYEESLKKGE